ncbi:MAG: hypothetical protein LC746_10640 [Acidobacteria bacterium]|nr:hypothetical protein [Acidobacteriota bacterium]
MKLKIFVAVLAVALAWFAGRHYYRTGHVIGGDAQTLAESITAGEQVVNDAQTLSPGARVEVSGINGPVEIATTDSQTAEVHVENNVSDARDLENHKITVDRAADHITVRAENRGGGFGGFMRWLTGRGGGNHGATQRVVLKVPRQVTVAVRGVNGEVKVGEVEGAVRVAGINGAVTVGRAAGRAEVAGVNGNVTFAMSRLADDGVRVSGVNGNIELKLATDVNADLNVGGLSGGVTYDLKNVTVEDGGDNRSRFNARIGAGGAPIRINGVHGDVHLAYI